MIMGITHSVAAALPRRRFFLLAAASLAIAATSPAAEASDVSDPAAAIARLNASLLAAMKAGRTISFEQRMKLLQPALESSFDLSAVLKASVGLGWTSLSAADQAALLEAFRRYTVANYAANFDNYDGQRFEILPAQRSLLDGRVVVETKLSRPGGTQHRIDYVMRQTTSGWKAVDVLADGSISRVAVQRSDFGSVLIRGGAAGLAARLSAVTASLAAGEASPSAA